jgi:hypothetical protein
MKTVAAFIIILFGCRAAQARPNLDQDIRRLGLSSYEKIGRSVRVNLRKNFLRLSSASENSSIAESLDQVNDHTLVQEALIPLTAGDPQSRLNTYIDDVHRTMDLRRKYRTDFRAQPKVRARIQNIMMGAQFLLDLEIRSELDSSVEELNRVRHYLLTQGTFISKNSSKLTTEDLWWDWMWVRGYGFPSDLVEIHLQKVAAISVKAGLVWKERLRRYALSVALLSLRRNSEPVLNREKPAIVSLRLVNSALALSQPQTEIALVKELKLYLYRYLQTTGQTYEASQVKKEIAMDLFFAKGRQILMAPAAPWESNELSFFGKIFASVLQLFRSLFTFFTYGAGFLFVATPIELMLAIGALYILAKQARDHFKIEVRGFKARWKEHSITGEQGWKRIPSLTKDCIALFFEETKLAWKMFVASYTSAAVPFYSKVAASLLLFGIGLYINSARSLVEAVVNQMTM